MAGQQARVDRIDRSLKRLGFRLIKTGQSFRIRVADADAIAANSNPTMTLAEVEQWIGEFIKPKRA